MTPLLIAMAGLPGTGKSTLAAALAEALPAVVLDKDKLRAGLIPPDKIEYYPRPGRLYLRAAPEGSRI